MDKTLAKVLVFALSGAVLIGYGCGDDEDTTATTTTTTRATTTTTTTGMGGNGTGGMAAGGDSMGGGGSAACVTCSTFLIMFGQHMPSELCGFQSQDPNTGQLTCDPGSSCEIFSNALTCACVDQCAEDCGDNVCMGMVIEAQCAGCIDGMCGEQQDACLADT